MNYLGSRKLETKRLELRPQTFVEQKRLWEILMMPEVHQTFLTISKKYGENLKDWTIQEPIYKKKTAHANDPDVFEWSIFLNGTNTCIGKIGFHEAKIEFEEQTDKTVRGMGWYIDPNYQGNGYAYEAAKGALDYMFNKVKISAIQTSTGKDNPKSWASMEKLGFINRGKTIFVDHTFVDEPTEQIVYGLTKQEYSELKKTR